MPEALPRALRHVAERLEVASIDRLWIFPPLIRGRKEWGLVAVSRFCPDREDEARVVVILPYAAERTGRGLDLDLDVREQGRAPADRIPRVMDGVVRRSGEDLGALGDAREVVVGGDVARYEQLMGEFDPALFEEPVRESSP